MANIRIKDLPANLTPNKDSIVPIDGLSTTGPTIENLVLMGRPSASQAEAEAGTDPVKAMTPLTTAQAIAAQGAIAFVPASQGIPPGGAVNQVLGKTSGSDYATSWRNAGAGDLISGNNLSDVANAATALDNLGGLSATLAASTYLTQAAAASSYQPLASNLTSWAAVNPSNYSTTAQIAAGYQPLDPDLTAISALGTAVYGRSLLTLANSTALAGQLSGFFRVEFDTVADAQAEIVAATPDAVTLAGQLAAGDLGGGLYVREGAPAVLNFQDTNGDYWNLKADEILPEQAGVVGNDATKGAANAVAFQKAADSGFTIKLATKLYYTDPFVMENGGIRGVKGRSFLQATNLVANLIHVDSPNPAVFEDFRIQAVGKTGGAAIYIDPATGRNDRSRYMGLEIVGFPIGIHNFNAINYGVIDCYFADYLTAGIWNQCDRLPDGGDSYVIGSTFITTLTTGLRAGLVQKNSGGMKFTGNKMLMGEYGYLLSAIGGSEVGEEGQSTSILLICANSFEHQRQSSILLDRDPAADPSIYFKDVAIVGNQFNGQDVPFPGSATPAIIAANAALSLQNLSVTGNVMTIGSNGGTAISITKADGAVISSNVIRGGNTSGTSVGITIGSSFEGTVGPNSLIDLDTPYFADTAANVRRADRSTQQGSVTTNPTTLYAGTLYRSAPTAVVFDPPFLEVPKVMATVSNGGSGGLSVLVSGVTVNGFNHICTAVNNTSTVSFDWEATGLA